MSRPSLGQQGPPDYFRRFAAEAVHFAFKRFPEARYCLGSSVVNPQHSTAQSMPSFGEYSCRCDWHI